MAYDREEYEIIRKCSADRDCSAWNQWREGNRETEVVLPGADLSGLSLQNIDLSLANLEGADLSNTDLKGAQLAQARCRSAIMHGALFDEAHLPGADFTRANLTNASFRHAGLFLAKMDEAVANHADFTDADMRTTELRRGSFVEADFEFAHVTKADFSGTNLSRSTFEHAVAQDCIFEDANLSSVVFADGDFSKSRFWHARFELAGIHKAASLSRARFLLDKLDDYLFLKDKDILFCHARQYELLARCSAKKDLTEWNNENPWFYLPAMTKRIYLAGVTFDHMFLDGARLWNADMRGSQFYHVTLKNAQLGNANLGGAEMNYSPSFEGAMMREVNLRGAVLGSACFRSANLFGADLEEADLGCADLSGVDLRRANLRNAKSILAANCENALLEAAHLEGANFYKCNFSGVDFHRSIVDGSTSMYQCQVNLQTDFRCVALDSIGIDATTKRLLECNMRRKNWNDWYWRTTWESEKVIYKAQGSVVRTCSKTAKQLLLVARSLPVRLFWWTSDYGTSPLRLLKCLVAVWVLFTLLYFTSPKCIINLRYPKGASAAGQTKMDLLVRSAYFSALTMTTLGLSDMYPAPHTKGQVLVLVQMVLAYFLLAALVTYLGILFTSGGPFLIYTYPHSDFPR